MKTIFEKLWEECFAEDCARMKTEEERRLAKNVAKKGREIKKLLTEEQSGAIEAYEEAIYELQSYLVRRAFLKGIDLATSFSRSE